MSSSRFDVFLEKHIGIGIRWQKGGGGYPLAISIAVMCLTIVVCIGKEGAENE